MSWLANFGILVVVVYHIIWLVACSSIYNALTSVLSRFSVVLGIVLRAKPFVERTPTFSTLLSFLSAHIRLSITLFRSIWDINHLVLVTTVVHLLLPCLGGRSIRASSSLLSMRSWLLGLWALWLLPVWCWCDVLWWWFDFCLLLLSRLLLKHFRNELLILFLELSKHLLAFQLLQRLLIHWVRDCTFS